MVNFGKTDPVAKFSFIMVGQSRNHNRTDESPTQFRNPAGIGSFNSPWEPAGLLVAAIKYRARNSLTSASAGATISR
jgi:hypothetical protein